MLQIRSLFPLPVPSPSPAADSSETNLDVSMVIVPAALLCAIVGGLAVNFILHWVARRRRRRYGVRDSSGEAAGVEKGELEKIPVAVFGAEGRMRMRGTECAICLGEFENGDELRILPKCNHGFHLKCIDAWLVSHSSCPNCRRSLLQKKTAEGGCSGGGGGEVRRPGNDQPGSARLPGDILIRIAPI